MRKNCIKGTAIILLTAALLGGCGGKSAGSYYKDGIGYFNSGDYVKAEASISKALEINGDRADYYIDYGLTLVQLGKYDAAIPYFDRAILKKDNTIVNENNKSAYRGKGIALYRAHRYPEAVEQFNKALAIDELTNLNLDILYYKAEAQEKAGLFEAAAITCTDILKVKGDEAGVYNKRADIYRLQGEYEKSLKDYNKAIELAPNTYEFYFGKYFLLMEDKDTDGATAVLNKAASIKGTTQKDKFNMAKVNYYLGDYEVAIAEFDEALKEGFTSAYFFLGNIYEKKEEYENAINNYTMYIEEEPVIESAAVYNQLSVCLMKQEKYKEALNYITEGLAYNDLTIQQSLQRNEVAANEHLGNFEVAYKLMKEYTAKYTEDEAAAKEFKFLETRQAEYSTVKEKENQ